MSPAAIARIMQSLLHAARGADMIHACETAADAYAAWRTVVMEWCTSGLLDGGITANLAQLRIGNVGPKKGSVRFEVVKTEPGHSGVDFDPDVHCSHEEFERRVQRARERLAQHVKTSG